MGNTHDTEIARIEADYIHTRWRTNEDYRWGYTNERGTSVCLSVGRSGSPRRSLATNPGVSADLTPPTCIIRSIRETEATGRHLLQQGTCFFYPTSIIDHSRSHEVLRTETSGVKERESTEGHL